VPPRCLAQSFLQRANEPENAHGRLRFGMRRLRAVFTNLRLSVQSTPGWNQRIETSPDLMHWLLWTNAFSASGSLLLQDSSASTAPRRFYRAVLAQ
jgi:hypothetical protein